MPSFQDALAEAAEPYSLLLLTWALHLPNTHTRITKVDPLFINKGGGGLVVKTLHQWVLQTQARTTGTLKLTEDTASGTIQRS